MIHKTLDRIQELLSTSKLDTAQKKSLSDSYKKLHTELQILAASDRAHAKTLTEFAHIATEEALHDRPHLDLAQSSREELQLALARFQLSHPGLANAIQTLLTHLSSIGI